VSGFSARWLALREPCDHAARNRAVLDRLAELFANADAVAVADLGCGTGATMRAISPMLPKRQHWRLVDDDETLLACAAESAPSGAKTVIASIDLAQHLEQAIGEETELVTMSALLDLVSDTWLDCLVAAMVRLRRPLYAALSYDGDVAITPANPNDSIVIAAVNRHQLTDKGFGPALGPGAAREAPERFRGGGFAVMEGRSDWSLDAADHEIQLEMLAGWAAAASEVGVLPALVAQWLAERRDHVARGHSRIRVGHIDFIAWPTGWR
jgi:hypothetical protein